MSKEAHKIAARIAVRTFPVDTLEANHRIKAWDEGRVDVDLDPNDPVVRAHRLNRVVIPDDKLMECLTAEEVGFSTWTRFLGGTKVTGTIVLNTETDIRLVIKLSGADRDSKAPTGTAVINTTVAEIGRCLDVQKLCLPLAGRAYRTLRSALYRGNAAEIDAVERGLGSRLWQLREVPRCKDGAVRDALYELIAINDAFIEHALTSGDAAQTIELIRQHVEGNVTLNEELGEMVREVRAQVAAEKERKARAITTVADMMEEKERARQRRKELKDKRAKQASALAPISAEDAAAKVVAALGLDPDDDLADLEEVRETSEEPVENEEVEADSAEADPVPVEAPTAATHAPAGPRLTARQQRMMDAAKSGKDAADPAPEAPKPTKPEAPKAEPVKLDFKSALLARKAAMPVAADSAPATETAPSEPAKSE